MTEDLLLDIGNSLAQANSYAMNKRNEKQFINFQTLKLREWNIKQIQDTIQNSYKLYLEDSELRFNILSASNKSSGVVTWKSESQTHQSTVHITYTFPFLMRRMNCCGC